MKRLFSSVQDAAVLLLFLLTIGCIIAAGICADQGMGWTGIALCVVAFLLFMALGTLDKTTQSSEPERPVVHDQ